MGAVSTSPIKGSERFRKGFELETLVMTDSFLRKITSLRFPTKT
jgi:hypothetical protein